MACHQHTAGASLEGNPVGGCIWFEKPGSGGNETTADLMDVEYLTKPIEETYSDRVLEGILKKISANSFQQKLSDANHASKHVGNTYTASVFLGLASLIDRVSERDELTPGKSIVLFSYGSGALATMYRLQM